MQEKLTYSVTEAAEVLQVSRPTVYTLLKRADFPAFNIGRRVLIDAAGLKEWVMTQSREAGLNG